MYKIIFKLLSVVLGLLLAAYLVPGIEVNGLYAATIAAVVLGFLNLFVRPILVILTLPINIITIGLFVFVINAGLFMFAASFLDGFVVEGFWSALLGSLVVSVVSSIATRFLK